MPDDEAERQATGGHDAFARHLAPVGADGGRVGITVEVGIDLGHHQLIGQRQRLGVDLRAADDPDLVRILTLL